MELYDTKSYETCHSTLQKLELYDKNDMQRIIRQQNKRIRKLEFDLQIEKITKKYRDGEPTHQSFTDKSKSIPFSKEIPMKVKSAPNVANCRCSKNIKSTNRKHEISKNLPLCSHKKSLACSKRKRFLNKKSISRPESVSVSEVKKNTSGFVQDEDLSKILLQSNYGGSCSKYNSNNDKYKNLDVFLEKKNGVFDTASYSNSYFCKSEYTGLNSFLKQKTPKSNISKPAKFEGSAALLRSHNLAGSNLTVKAECKVRSSISPLSNLKYSI
ncbi:unnamed protein product [Moneuplotes crassus]|uniref:Uncharacterized protein n=1 Tax=Euplotes crassus TaxID=5936 RepID=A0AAD1XQV8_EUPCR|nr:unnamed protein product [Moneuplotes crassus]